MKTDTTESIKSKLYPYIKSKFNKQKFNSIMEKFINSRSQMLYDTCPCDRIIYTQEDKDLFFNTLQIDPRVVNDAISNTYYADIPNFNPLCVKDDLTMAVLCVIRYLLLEEKDKKALELACVYLSFSGKFYPSIHFMSFPKFPPSEYRYIMEYTVNNKLSSKFDLKSQGSVIKTIISIDKTWIESYGDKFKDFDDEDCVYIIQQIRDRIKSFMKNIANEYYTSYVNKEYITYDSDSDDEDNFHQADSNSLRNNNITERVVNNVTTRDVDYRICKYVSDSNVKPLEIKDIIQCIVSDNRNIPAIRELCSLLITDCDSMGVKPEEIRFINVCLAPKPNSKNERIIRIKQILESWLSENSPAYNKRKSRLSTKNSYHRSVLGYFAILIHNNCK